MKWMVEIVERTTQYRFKVFEADTVADARRLADEDDWRTWERGYQEHESEIDSIEQRER